MSKFLDKVLLKDPTSSNGLGVTVQPQTISPSRIGFSFLGLILGIFLSFIIVGIDIITPASNPGSPATSVGLGSDTAKATAAVGAKMDTAKNANVKKMGDTGKAALGKVAETTPTKAAPTLKKINWDDLWKIGIVTLVICGLTYHNLYLSLKLYVDEPAFLTIFIAFQYGFFWQAFIQGAATLIHPSGT